MPNSFSDQDSCGDDGLEYPSLWIGECFLLLESAQCTLIQISDSAIVLYTDTS